MFSIVGWVPIIRRQIDPYSGRWRWQVAGEPMSNLPPMINEVAWQRYFKAVAHCKELNVKEHAMPCAFCMGGIMHEVHSMKCYQCGGELISRAQLRFNLGK